MKFLLRNIHQIEITSHCDLRCKYCVHRQFDDARKMDMSADTFAKALAWVKVFKARGTQGALNLAGIGESTLHPQFVDFLALAREALGPDHHLDLATNGVSMTAELARAMAPHRPRVWVSLHRPERAGPAIDHLLAAGLHPMGVSVDAAVSGTDWAGQVKWTVRAPRTPCPWVTGGWAIVLSDGRVTRCSFDGFGKGTLGTVDDDLTRVETAPYALCAKCHQDVGVRTEAEVAA